MQASEINDTAVSGFSTIRMTTDTPPKASCIDFVRAVTGKNNRDSSGVIRNLQKQIPGFFTNIEQHQFPGAGQKMIYVLCASEAIELLMMLPGNRAKAFRRECTGLLTQLFSGDPDLVNVLARNALVSDPVDSFCEYLKDVAPTVIAGEDEGGESHTHSECKFWVSGNINCISFATGVCPGCSAPVLGLSVFGGIPAVEASIPGTSYIADILVKLPNMPVYVAVEVAHTHLVSAKKMFESRQAGNVMYEVETKEIRRAMAEQRPFSSHILYTTCTESVLCMACSANNLSL